MCLVIITTFIIKRKQQIYGVVLEEESGFGGAVWYRYVETAYKEEGDHTLKAALIAVGSGAVELERVKAKRT